MRKNIRPKTIFSSITGGGKTYIAILIIAILFAACSCRQTVLIPVEIPEEWTITIINNPSEAGITETYTKLSNQRFSLPEPEAKDGFTFSYYSLPDGTELKPGDRLKYDGSNIIVTANWAYDLDIEIPETGTGTNVLTDAINGANGNDVIINLPLSAGETATYTETERITIKENQHVVINGASETGISMMSLLSPISDNAPTINGSFILSRGSSLTLNNVKLTDAENYLIYTTSGGVEVNISNSSLITAPNKYAVITNISENPDEDVVINLDNTYVGMKATNSSINYGASGAVFVRGDSTQKHDYDDQLDYASVTITNCEFEDISEGNFSIIPVQLDWADEIDLTVENTDIIVNKNHYAIRFYGVGKEDTVSDLRIDNCNLKAWASLYIQADSRNVKGTVSNSTLTGVNENSGDTDGFATISIDSSAGNEIDFNNCTIIFNKNAKASQQAVSIYYYDHTGIDGGNIVNFKNCSFEFNQVPTAELPVITSNADSIMTRNGRKIDGWNYINFDDATINSLSEYGYRIEKTEDKIAIDPSDANVGETDEDGYTFIPYEKYNFYYPEYTGNRVPDNEPYQLIQIGMNLVAGN